MRNVITASAFVLAAGLASAGCGSPPQREIDEAAAAWEKTATVQADQYAADALQDARAARARLDAELAVQEKRWIKSYERSKELADAARSAAERAYVAAVEAKDAAARRSAEARVDAARTARARSTRGGVTRDPIKTKDVRPVYPAIAQSARVSGSVTIEATVDAEGKVREARVVRSVPLLDQAALDAVRQWEYEPSLVNGKPVPVVVTVTVNFVRS